MLSRRFSIVVLVPRVENLGFAGDGDRGGKDARLAVDMANRGTLANCEGVGPDVGRGVLESAASCSTCFDNFDGVGVAWFCGRLFIRNRRGEGVWPTVRESWTNEHQYRTY